MGILFLTIKEITSKIRMNKLILLGFCVIALAAMVTAQVFKDEAAPSGENCYCQCSDLTYQDRFGRTHGNCKSTKRGARWCYVKPHLSDCHDLQKSTRFNAQWSYQACSTPGLNSPECSRFPEPMPNIVFGRSEVTDLRNEIADVNGDGAIDRNEFNWAFPNVDLYEEFGKLDTNNDGFIDETEGRGKLFKKLIGGAKKLFNKLLG